VSGLILEQEIGLCRATEGVAAARRELPPGGVVPEDYVFHGSGVDGAPTGVRLSELFAPGKDSLAIYSFMFPRDASDLRPGPASGETAHLKLHESPCPSCVALLDQRDGAVEHVSPLVNFAVVAKSPLLRILSPLLGLGALLRTYRSRTGSPPRWHPRARLEPASLRKAARSTGTSNLATHAAAPASSYLSLETHRRSMGTRGERVSRNVQPNPSMRRSGARERDQPNRQCNLGSASTLRATGALLAGC
jgi:hypothetical protein